MNRANEQAIMSLAAALMRGAVSPTDFFAQLTETIAQLVGCSRTSVWRYTNADRDAIVCEDLFDARHNSHQAGGTLQRDQFSPYFSAIRANVVLMATHARFHPATECFNDAYFLPNDIHSLLDVNIDAHGKPWGLFCCEHTGEVKEWTDADAAMLRSIGTMCGMALGRIRDAGTGTAVPSSAARP